MPLKEMAWLLLEELPSFFPAKKRRDDKPLPQFELKRLSGPFAFRVLEETEKLDGVIRCVGIEIDVVALQVVNVTLAGQADPFAGGYFAGQDLVGVLGGGVSHFLNNRDTTGLKIVGRGNIQFL